jgi:RNA polymerase sigma-70 factor (ECF subfamily)
VRDALGKVSEERRTTLVLVEWNGLSGPEAAEVLGVPVGAVWQRLHEAREELRRRLAKGER